MRNVFYRFRYLPSNGTTADVMLHHFDLCLKGQPFSCNAFAIQISQWQWMSPADLNRIAQPPTWSCSCWIHRKYTEENKKNPEFNLENEEKSQSRYGWNFTTHVRPSRVHVCHKLWFMSNHSGITLKHCNSNSLIMNRRSIHQRCWSSTV